MKQIETWLRDFEEDKVSLSYSFGILLIWIFLRTLLEGILEIYQAIGFGPFFYQRFIFYFLHLPLFYTVIFLLVVFLTSLICDVKITHVTKSFATGFFIILLVPIIDAFASKGFGYHLHYPDDIFYLFAHALLPKHVPDSSWGQRIVVLLSCLGVGSYAYVKTKSILKSVLLFFLAYVVIVFIGGFSSLLVNIVTGRPVGNYLRQGGFLLSDTQKYVMTYLFLVIPLLLLYSLRFDFKQTILFLKSLRWERNILFAAMCMLGFFIGYSLFGDTFPNAFKNFFDYFAVAALPLIGFFSFQGAAVINDFYDRPADTITRSRNPLTAEKKINAKFYLVWGIILIVLSLLIALCLNFSALILIFSAHLLAFIYSAPPVRLKKIPILSTFNIAFITLLCTVTGFTIFSDEGAFLAFPPKLAYALLIGVTFGFIAKDIHDIEGDRAQGIFSIPVIFGKNISAFFIGISFFIFPILFGTLELFVIALIFGTASTLYIILHPKPNEGIYFAILLLFGLLLVIYFNKYPKSLKANSRQQKIETTSEIYQRAKENLNDKNFEEAEKLFTQVIKRNKFFE
jgi:4-hydroxybenzoate polyprenyltransferase